MLNKLLGDGDSTIVVLPLDVLRVVGLSPGDEVEIFADAEQGCIIIRPTGLLAVLNSFSDDFMITRDQPESQVREFYFE